MPHLARRLNDALSLFLRLRHAPVGLLVAVLALAAFLPAFTTLPPVDRDEARFAQASKQMVESGDFVDIRFQDGPRYKKPVGIYWLQSAAVATTGGPRDAAIWHYRLPSLLAALIAAALTARIAVVFGGAAAGFAAGVPMAAMFLLGVEAHLAKTDAVLLALILGAQWVLAGLYRDARAASMDGASVVPVGRVRFAIFWAALAAATLVKGPIGPGVVALTAAALALGHRRIGWLRALRPGRGLILFVLLVVPWFAAITWRAGWGFWDAALGRDLLGKIAAAQEQHGAPPGSYAALLWLTFQPAAIALALALAAIWRGRRTPGIAFAAAWALPAWIVFEALPTKLPHYVLPLYPALALAIGLVWAETAAARFGPLRRAVFALLGALPIAVIVATAGYAVSQGAWPALPVIAALALAGAGLWLAWVALREGLAHAASAGLWLIGAGLLAGVLPVAARIPALWPAPAIIALIPPDPACKAITLYETGFDEPSLVFLAPGPVKAVPPDAAGQALTTDRCAAAVVPEANANALFRARRLGGVSGLNLGTGRAVQLSVYGPPAKP